MQKLRSAAFYLKSPVYWAHFSHRAMRYFQANLDGDFHQAQASVWAGERAQPLAVLLAKFGLIAGPSAVLPGGRMFGYDILWKALKPGGIFLSDDIQDNMAFADFVRRKDASFGVVEGGNKYIGLAVKPGLRI